MIADRPVTDVCLIVEGAYPYIAGGVSSWMHDLIRSHPDLTFSLLTLSADSRPKELRFELPKNVLAFDDIPLHQDESRIPRGSRRVEALIASLEDPLTRLLDNGGLSDVIAILRALKERRSVASRAVLMNSEATYALVERMYEKSVPGSSFMHYFWTWRALAGGLFSTLLAPIPPARVYHAISTGYAGLVAARAAVETQRPALLTEHGIYTNERRVEIALADWLADRLPLQLDLVRHRKDLRDVWVSAFSGYARACYEACACITTLYEGNQVLQRRDGAPPEKLRIIPNGIDYETYSSVVRAPDETRPTVALIGRVVPIKDVKTFIRACHVLAQSVPNARALILGPTEEDEEYVAECRDLVAHLGLETVVEFTGRVSLTRYLPQVDVVCLTSISEAQPLVLLEAGAAGIPSVATDVGSCREIIEGRSDETPALGCAGYVVPLSNPVATARALADLMTDPDKRKTFGDTIRQRTARYYNKRVVDVMYRKLYDEHLGDQRPLCAAE